MKFTLHRRPKTERRARQAGNLFFMLFAAVALAGAVGVGASQYMKGIVKTMSDVTRKSIAEERMTSAARLVFQYPAENTPGADCDVATEGPATNTTKFLEPMETRAPDVVKPQAVPGGGGLIPKDIGASVTDPWGTEYGYCAWDFGVSQCATSVAPRRLAGPNDPNGIAVAVISAGKNKKFEATCNALAGGGPAADCTGLGSGYYNDPVSGHCYFVSNTEAPFKADIGTECSANGAYLAEITSPAEQAVIESANALNLGDATFISGEDIGETGNWFYSPGGPSAGTQFWTGGAGGSAVGGAYTHWKAGMPAALGTSEACATIHEDMGTFFWDSFICNYASKPYLCEKAPGGAGAGAVTKPDGSDDLVMKFTYNDVQGLGGKDLWKVNDTQPDTATINKNIEVDGGGSFNGALELMKQGLILPTDVQAPTCTSAEEGNMRINTATNPIGLEICHANDWTALSIGQDASGPADCSGLGAASYNDATTGHCYWRGPDATSVDHDTAQAACTAAGGYLAVPSSAAETTAIANVMGSEQYFLGMKNMNLSTGDFAYSYGEKAGEKFWAGFASGATVGGNYANWFSGEPNNDLSDEACVVLNLYGRGNNWTDAPCNFGSTNYICEKTGTVAAAVPAGGNAVCAGASGPGTTCTNGSVYIGDYNNYHYYTTKCDVGQTWNGSACTGTRSQLSWNNGNTSGYKQTAAASEDDGQANTTAIVSLDSDTVTAGVQPHQMAQACSDLTANGFSDWYLGASQEMHDTMWVNRAAVGNFNTSTLGVYYPTSTETHYPGDAKNYARIDMTSNYIYGDGDAKASASFVRCLRREAASYNAVPTGAKLWLKFDETSGTSAADSSGSGNNATLVPTSSFVTGKNGNALDVDNASGRAVVANESNFDFERNQDFTVAGWFYRRTASGEDDFFGKVDPSDNYTGYAAWALGNEISVYVQNPGGHRVEERFYDVAPNTWVHYAFVFNFSLGATAANLHVYKNGTEITTSVQLDNLLSGDSILNNRALWVGNYEAGGDYSMNGKIDDFVVYPKALTSSEVWALYNADPSAVGGGGGGSTTPAGANNFNSYAANCTAAEGGPFTLAATNDTGDYNSAIAAYGSYVLGSSTVGPKAYTSASGTLTAAGAFAGEYAKDPADDIYVAGNVIFTARGYGQRMNAYTFDGTNFKKVATATLPTNGINVWSDGTYVYATTAGGILAYAFNGTSFKLLATYPTSATANGIWGDGTYLYAAINDRLTALKFDGTTFTELASYTSGLAAVDITGDKTNGYIFVAAWAGGVKAFTFNGTAFTLKATFSDTGRSKDVFYDGIHVFTTNDPSQANDSRYLTALKFNGTSFAQVATINVGVAINTIWGDGKYIYAGNNGDSKIYAFTGFTCTAATTVDNSLTDTGVDVEPNPAVIIGANANTGKLGVGDINSCMIKPDNSLWCAGSDTDYFQLGNGTAVAPVDMTADKDKLSLVSGNSAWTSISAGYLYACGIKSDASAWCWGEAANGKLGNNLTTPNQPAPVAVSGGYLWQQISAGSTSTCGIRNDGALYCWGSDSNGLLGNGAAAASNVPSASSDTSGWVKVSVGQDAACGIKVDGTLWCWGSNSNSQIGNGTSTGSFQSPVEIAEPGPWVSIAVGAIHACAVKLDGSLWCWGGNGNGQLGVTEAGNRYVPNRINDKGPWLNVLTGPRAITTCGIKMDGTAWCWGQDNNYQQGSGAIRSGGSINRVADPGPWVTLGLGTDHTCGIKLDGSAWCWGSDTGGRLANGSTLIAQQSVPSRVVSYPGQAPFTWDDSETTLTATGTSNISFQGGSAISYDGSVNGGVSDGLRFDTGGQTVLRQSGGLGSTGSSTGPAVSGLISYWAFEEGSGTTAKDSGPGANNGTILGGATYTTGKYGNALSLDGVNDYVNVPSSPAIDNLQAFTTCGWISVTRRSATGWTALFDKTTNSLDGWQLYLNDGDPATIGWGIQDPEGVGYQQSSAGAYNTWHHVCIGWAQGQNTRLWVNGTQYGGGAASTTIVNNDTGINLHFGGVGNGPDPAAFLKGGIDELMFFNRLLSTSEVTSVMNYASGPGDGVIRGSEMKLDAQAAAASSQLTWKAASAGNIKSIGLDYQTKSFEFLVNNSSANGWAHTLNPQMEITTQGQVGLGTTGTAKAMLDLNSGGLRVGNDTTECFALRAGALRFTGSGNVYEYCNGASWVGF